MSDVVERGNGKRWVEEMHKRDPGHAKYYCDHGVYIGSNGMFRINCKDCNA